MLHVLPTEMTLNVLSHLPIPSLLSLSVLSRQWLDFFTTNQSEIFHSAALLHEYIQPEILSLDDALSVNTSRPWAGLTSWKDFCHRSFQLRKNWEGKGRVVMRVLSPPGFNVHRIKVDEKAGICITTHSGGGLSVIHLFSSTVLWCLPLAYVRPYAHCEYDNGFLVFDREDGAKEVWRLASDLSTEGEVAADAPPDSRQMDASARAVMVYHQYAPRGQFRPWALLTFPEATRAYRLAYPTLICASDDHAFLHDVRTGYLVQTIDFDIHLQELSYVAYVDVNERHAFVSEQDAVHVFSRESGSEVLQIPADATVESSRLVEDPSLVSGDSFIAPLSVSPNVDDSRPGFVAAHVSRDGRDLVVLSDRRRKGVVFIRDFERICRGEISLEQAGLVLSIPPWYICCYLGFEHGRVCVATVRVSHLPSRLHMFMLVDLKVQGLFIFTFGSDLSAKAVFVRPTDPAASVRLRFINCMQLTDSHIYFMWQDARHRQDIPLFKDEENARELPPPITPTLIGEFQEQLLAAQPGGRSFTTSVPLGADSYTLYSLSYIRPG
ncbi:hypothetical protein EDB92DRAFT_2032795 [Lactarius akahatsu]|uniref:F-box domain-containing protein n=1 Tax=Lactarius akahatsu TaxID=416441 RepID=A0AAD4LBH1_9AGAM|nr:hypothetical protein EDB92DRAFT_2032795 [Lactarius akahatsu]